LSSLLRSRAPGPDGSIMADIRHDCKSYGRLPTPRATVRSCRLRCLRRTDWSLSRRPRNGQDERIGRWNAGSLSASSPHIRSAVTAGPTSTSQNFPKPCAGRAGRGRSRGRGATCVRVTPRVRLRRRREIRSEGGAATTATLVPQSAVLACTRVRRVGGSLGARVLRDAGRGWPRGRSLWQATRRATRDHGRRLDERAYGRWGYRPSGFRERPNARWGGATGRRVPNICRVCRPVAR
jgi:hypothetical protein